MDTPKVSILDISPAKGDAEGDHEAAADILEAIADKDAGALSLALKRFYEDCAGDMGDDEDDSDEE